MTHHLTYLSVSEGIENRLAPSRFRIPSSFSSPCAWYQSCSEKPLPLPLAPTFTRHAHTHARTHARTQARTHARTHTCTPLSSAIPKEEFVWNLGALSGQ